MNDSGVNSYYDILGVEKDADASTLKKAWHKLSLKYHPDRLSEDDRVRLGDKMKEINEAYDVLSDPKKRQIYDRFGKKGLTEATGMDPMDRQQRNDLVPPIQIALHVELKDLYSGKKTAISFPRKNMCTECDMTGAKNKVRKICLCCGGDGCVMSRMRQGPFIQQRVVPCRECRGTGLDPDTVLCDICKGSMHIEEHFTTSCEIHPGSCHETIIEVKNQGHEIPPKLHNRYKQMHGLDSIKEGHPPRGDVLIIIQEKEHPVFVRTNTGEADLAVNIELSLAEALCGFSRSIEHLDGRKLSVIETGPTSYNEIRVIKQEGMPRKSNPMIRGNLLLKFSVTFPTNYDKHGVYKCLTGKSLADVDFSPPPDHSIAHTCHLSEIEVEEEEKGQPQVGCPVQ